MTLRRKHTLYFSLLLLLCILLLTQLHIAASNSNLSVSLGTDDYKLIADNINMTNVQLHAEFLSSLNSRVTGYPNCGTAASYIEKEFKKYLDDVQLKNYTVVVPFDYGANISITSPKTLTLKAYPLWPNLIETCETTSTGVSGKLIYGGHGDLADFNGKDVFGSIVLMEFNSGKNWVNAAMLGAKAIIFIEPGETTTDEAELKSIDVPLDIPRLYVTRDEADQLKDLLASDNGDLNATITSKMVFEEKQTSNIVGLIEGSDPELKNQIIAVCAHYDSISVAPSVAPGADEAAGIVVLLELARLLNVSQPKRTIMLLALSGHNLALAGAREFVDKYFDEIGSKIKLLINLDLSAEADGLAALYIGHFYRFDASPGRFTWVRHCISGFDIIDALDLASWTWYVHKGFTLDSEPFTVAGGLGFSLVTIPSVRNHWNTPLDTFDRLDFENLKPQLHTVFSMLYSFAEEAEIPEYKPTRFDPEGGGFPTLRGQVVKYNITRGWYDPMPNALVFLQAQPATFVIGHKTFLVSNKNGEFVFKGAVSSTGVGLYERRYYTMQAYIDNPSPSPVEYATAFGRYGLGPGSIIIDKADNFVKIAIFECGSIAIFHTLSPFIMGQMVPFLEVNDIRMHDHPDFWGAVADLHEAIMFVPLNLSVEITMKKYGDVQPLAILVNASEGNPQGYGYTVRAAGECIYLTHTPLLFAADGIYWVTKSRLQICESKGLQIINAKNTHKKATEYLHEAYTALDNKQYDVFYAKAFGAWSLGVQAYGEVNGLMKDTINTTVSFFVLLIPFAFLAESLLFKFTEGRKMLVATSAIFGVFVAILYFAHPGFHLISSIFMTLIGFIIFVLLIPVLSIVMGEAFKYLGETRLKMIGKHFTSISRLSALTTAFSTGVSNMKRRKLRTTLTIITLTLITFSLISFTSISAFSIVRARERSGKTLYNGILIRTTSWSPLSTDLLSYFNALYSQQAIICPRSWLYANPQLIGPNGAEVELLATLGVIPSEANLTQLDNTLAEGSWFSGSQYNVCIISNSTAKALSVEVNQTVSWSGLNLTVIGIMNESEMRSRIDLDQESILPLHPLAPEKTVHVMPEQVLVIPYALAMGHGAQIRSIALMPYDSEIIYGIASEIANVLTEVDVYGGRDGAIGFYIKGAGYTFHGWSLLPLPLFIAAFIILTSMLGAVHERIKEIAIYSSVGLSPMHVAGLFVAESIVYAVLGAVFGYTLGMVGYPVLIAVGALPAGVPFNYSSSWVIMTLSICMVVTLLSTVYPVYEASHLVTPSVERVWKIPTKPKEGQWTIPLPFVATSEKEALGIITFIKEYFEVHATERADVIFATKALSYQEEGKNKSLMMIIRLAPFEMGVVQETRINAKLPAEEKRYHFDIYFHRLGGPLRIWETVNRKFADEVRKQLLIWRGLRHEDKEQYIKRSSELKEIEEKTEVENNV